jgi:tetratricopeptide (TPR) repeat protein
MKLLLKRILAGGFDISLVALFSFAYFLLLKHSGDTVMMITYYVIIRQYQTTPGGIVFGLKVSPINSDKKLMSFLRVFLLFLPLIVLIKAVAMIGTAFLLILINIIPALFTEKRLMLHDIISRSFVEKDERNIFTKKHKVFIWLGFIGVIIFWAGSSYNFGLNKINECQSLYKEEKYQEVIKQCSFIKNYPDTALVVGKSYTKMKNYDDAIKYLTLAESLGSKEATSHIAIAYMAKDDFEKALQLSEKVDDKLQKQILKCTIYAAKFGQTQNADDLITALAYLKLFSADFDVIQDPAKKAALSEGISGSFNSLKDFLTKQADQFLSEEQKAKIDPLVQQLQATK